MKRRFGLLVVLCVALVFAGCAGSSGDALTAGGAGSGETVGSPGGLGTGEPAGDSEAPPVGPYGVDYQVFASGVRLQMRPGESRVVSVPFRSVGLLGGVWPVSLGETYTPDYLSLTTSLPASIDFDATPTTTIPIGVSVASDAPVGGSGSYSVSVASPAGGDQPYSGGASVFVKVVGAGVVVGPSAVRDYVAVSGSSAVFDPTVNDFAGDAVLDLGSLSVLSGPVGLVVSGLGELTYTPGQFVNVRAEYEICDLNGLCAQATVDLYAER